MYKSPWVALVVALAIVCSWAPGARAVTAIGGAITTNAGYVIHTFTNSGIFTVTAGGNVDVLVVAGGGGGGAGGYGDGINGNGGGGGGAGGLIYTNLAVGAVDIAVTVGAGGVGSVTNADAANGSNSTILTLTAVGGGCGASGGRTQNPGNGGSGGGGSYPQLGPGTGTAGQGNNGGAGHGTDRNPGASGGGAGSAGVNAPSDWGSGGLLGGAGVTNSITGSPVAYAGGGGSAAGAHWIGAVGAGGSGVGGDSGSAGAPGSPGSTGKTNTGGGGGGGGGSQGAYQASGGSGGSGVVIVRYAVDGGIPSAYAYRAPITFGGYGRSEALTNFPALVVLSTNSVTNFLYSQVLSTNGYDIAFFDNGVPQRRLNHEIERWDSTSNSYVWVQVPVLTNNAVIWAYWGNANATSAPAYYATNGAAWDSTFGGVWHLNEASGIRNDSTTNRNSGTPTGCTATNGTMAGGVWFNGSSDYIQVPSANSLQPQSKNVTVSLWLKGTFDYSSSGGAMMVEKGGWNTGNYGLGFYNGQPTKNAVRWSMAESSPNVVDGTAAVNDGKWHHAAGTWNGTTRRLCVDGQQQTSAADTSGFTADTEPLCFGRRYGDTGNWYKGALDEIRISLVARSTNWDWAEYMTVASNTAFASYGTEQLTAQPGWSGAGVATITATSAVATATLGGANADVYLFWDTTDKGLTPALWGNTNFIGSNEAVGTISGVLSNLVAGANYAFRFYGTNTTAGTIAWSTPAGTFNTGEIAVTATVANVSEAGSGIGQFTVYRPAALTNTALTVNFTVGGTATYGTDYTVTPSTNNVTILAGSNTATITVSAIDNNTVDGNRTVTLTLQPGIYVVGASSNDTVKIWDDEYASNYRYNAPIQFSGYTKSETLTNFPVLVLLGANTVSNFNYNQVSSTNGYDLRFFSSNRTAVLNHEIENWDPTTNAAIWVQVPVLTSNTTIWAYWGNANATSAPAYYSTNGATWTNGYAGVWHLNQPNALDSTTNRNSFVAHGNTNTPGRIGLGQGGFNGSSTYAAAAAKSVFDLTDGTVECWVRPDWVGTATGNPCFVGNRGASARYSLHIDGDKTTVGMFNNSAYNSLPFNFAQGTWYYVAFVDRGATTEIFVNGVSLGTIAIGYGTIAGQPLNIGYNGNSGEWFNGAVDELRLSPVQSSSNWVWACYLNQASNTAFASYGAAGSSLISWSGPGTTNATATTTEGYATLNGTNGDVYLFWDTTDKGLNPALWGHTNFVGSNQATGLVSGVVMSNLTVGPPYVCRFYATNAAVGATAWSTPVSFLASGMPSLDNGGGVTNLLLPAAQLQGTLLAGSPSPSVWIYWGTSNGDTNKAAWNLPVLSVGQPAVGSSFKITVTGLLANQQYWYRCYGSNVNGEAWATASTNFTTPAPTLTLTPASTGILEGALGTTSTVTYTASLSATSAVPVTVGYATSNGTATAGSDYLAASGTLTVPAGSVTGQISVQIIGDNLVETDEVFYVNFSNAMAATLGTTQVSCTISNDDTPVFYVRNGGNDTNDGSDWSHAFATLQKAVAAVPYNQVCTINAESSTGSQAYAVCSRTLSGNPAALTIVLQGGWQNVDSSPVQTGMSVVASAATNQIGITLISTDHHQPVWLTVKNVVFSNVTLGVYFNFAALDSNGDNHPFDWGGGVLTLSNCAIYAQNHGVYFNYPKTDPSTAFGGPAQVNAVNVTILAGLGGAGDGINISGAWMGSSLAAMGTDPATGLPRVSSIRSASGHGVYFSGMNNEIMTASFQNTVIYGCASNAIHLDAVQLGDWGKTPPYVVRASLVNCTIVDNGGNGVDMLSQSAGSWASVTNSIFAGNAGHGVFLSSTNGAFSCPENYNEFFGNDLVVNGSAQSPVAGTLTSDPLLWVKGAKPDPWYRLSSYASPAYQTGSGGSSRGAYQTPMSTTVVAPMIASLAATNITENGADMVGNLTAGGAPVQVTCYWGTNDGGMNAGVWMTNRLVGVCVPGFVTNSVAIGLSPSTLYYYRYFASNSLTWNWATNSVPFSTVGTAVGINNDGGATNLTPTSATLAGMSTVGSPTPDVWIYWGTQDGLTNKGDWNLPVLAIGQPVLGSSFWTNIAGLSANQTYCYRCYASNTYGEAWAPASTNFTTPGPSLTLTPVSAGIPEGALGSTSTVVYTATLSAASVVDVSVDYSTSNGTATAVDNDYIPISGTLTISAGSTTGQVSVQIIGDNKVEPDETFYLNLSNAVRATIGTPQVSCTISNDDFTFYVRGDGSGSDSNDGSGWSHAFLTLNYALGIVPKPFNTSLRSPAAWPTPPYRILVQASAGNQAYAVASWTCGYYSPGPVVDLELQGGWENVDSAPTQTGRSVIRDATTNHPGIHIDQGTSHNAWKRVVVNRFAFTNVTRAVELTQVSGNRADILLTVSNTTVDALNDGLYVSYPVTAPTTDFGGAAKVMAQNVDIRAGLGGVGDGINVAGAWMGSSVTAMGTDPQTGASRVSSIKSAGGNGVYFSGMNNQAMNASFQNTVIYGCAGNAIHLDAAQSGGGGTKPNVVQASVVHCTIVDNGANGLDMLSQSAGSWASITNCLFSINGVHAVALSSTNNAFILTEDFNVFFGGDLVVNVGVQGPATDTKTTDPILYGQIAKPGPWYMLYSKLSPAYLSGSDGLNRGAYQSVVAPPGVVFTFR